MERERWPFAPLYDVLCAYGGELRQKEPSRPASALEKGLLATASCTTAATVVSMALAVPTETVALYMCVGGGLCATVAVSAESLLREVRGLNRPVDIRGAARFITLSNMLSAVLIVYGLGRPFLARALTGRWDRHRQYIPYPNEYQSQIGFHAFVSLAWFIAMIHNSYTGIARVTGRSEAMTRHALVGRYTFWATVLVAMSAVLVEVLPIVHEAPVARVLQLTTAGLLVAQVAVGYFAVKLKWRDGRQVHMLAMNGALGTASSAAIVRIIMDYSLASMEASKCVHIVTDQLGHPDLWHRVEGTWFYAALVVVVLQRIVVFVAGGLLRQFSFIVGLEILLLWAIFVYFGSSAFAFHALIGDCR
jgi:hypothetical protein